MTLKIQRAQQAFLQTGGMFSAALDLMRERGQLPSEDEYSEYPKVLRFPTGEMRKTQHSTETLKGKTVTWDVDAEIVREVTVHSEEEEERVLSNGLTNAQIEAEREGLLTRLRDVGRRADPKWSVLRLRRELGEAMDAPPADELAALQEKMARLEQIAALKARIAEMEAAAGVVDASADTDEIPRRHRRERATEAA